MSSSTTTFPIRVYYEDTDAGGIVYYANYLKFFERARTEYLRQLGISQSTFLEQNLGFVVRKVEMDNLASAKLDDSLTVYSTVIEQKRASLVFEQHIVNEQEKVLCKARFKIASVNLATSKPCAIPETILGALSRAR
ncbi:tol-pal system-associated acyl-CoA thioesterase [Thalassotalea agarivorans]|uniref:Acyl-CoA thioester hydrolase n=1 Tax=Thalassotalea agarivorans TaxID=349064 RepID=A0A1I0GWN0_THASX|nr:tol-pal system-associated acyl-CoA thioesterase [Thalassotalea agarivorans]SET74732.1 acyl-CoA thioester hydrolase [Thalassotalea agarivorans]